MSRTRRLMRSFLCAGGAAAVAVVMLGGGESFAADVANLAMMKGPDREKTLLDGAKKEGKVMLYSAMIVNQALRPLMEGFNKAYPGVTGEFFRADGRDIVNKVLAEQRARALQVDVVECGSIAQSFIEANLLEPFYSTSFPDYDKDLLDPKGLWAATRLNYYGLSYNTKLVSKSDVPKTYQEMLDPKHMNKYSWAADTENGGAMMFITALRKHLGEEQAEKFLQNLSKQKIVNASGSPRALVDRVIQGEYPMAIGMFAHHPLISAGKGAPVDSQMMDPIPSNSSDIMLMKNAPRPHAALLLIDFMMSREGQTLLQAAEYFPAHPGVDPLDSLKSIVPARIGMKQVFMSTETTFLYREKSIQLQKKYFD